MTNTHRKFQNYYRINMKSAEQKIETALATKDTGRRLEALHTLWRYAPDEQREYLFIALAARTAIEMLPDNAGFF